MENISTAKNEVSINDYHDDLSVLRRAFALPKIDYIDISHQARLTQMMLRWPLLAELAEQSDTETPRTEQQG